MIGNIDWLGYTSSTLRPTRIIMSRRKTPSSAGSSDDNTIPWPSTAAILETPDRKRPRRSLESTSDYNLSTSFGSPPSHQMPPTTSPLLRTPVHNGKTCIHLTPSPLSSFRVRESTSTHLKLSNPNNATEMRFTGSSLERHSPVKLDHGRALAPIQSNVSRCLNDTFRLDDSAYNSCNDSSLFFDSAKERRRSGILDTPSKLSRSSLDPHCSFDFSTSTPVKSSGTFPIFRSDFIPEQPSGRIETCVTDTSDFIVSPTHYIEPSPVKPPPKPVEEIPIITQSFARRLFPKFELPNCCPKKVNLPQGGHYLQYPRIA
uniref:TACC_C domain-containing protein n=1 Tax=Steinernema glaseri TaxID=37863 RepID=A0A1I7ZI72_9BILA